jgi:Fe2+ transport system protein FeoA
VITAVAGTTRLAARLREIGVIPGVKLKMLRTGTRIVFQLGESRYCLRRCDAETIQVCATSSGGGAFAR